MKHLASACLVWMLVGCSTPGDVLEQARHGAALSSALSESLTAYTARTRALDEERERLLAKSRADALQFRLLDRQAEQVFSLAGQSGLTAQYQSLRASADVIAKARDDARAEALKYAQSLDTLMAPLPGIDKNLAAVSKEFSGLGTELSSSRKLKVVTNAFKDIKAAGSAASAPAPAASAASSPT
jgi:hypothetical protein